VRLDTAVEMMVGCFGTILNASVQLAKLPGLRTQRVLLLDTIVDEALDEIRPESNPDKWKESGMLGQGRKSREERAGGAQQART